MKELTIYGSEETKDATIDIQQQQHRRFKLLSESRLFHAVREDSMAINAVASVFFCSWKSDFTSFLRTATETLLEGNPILTGCIEKGTHAVTGQTGLCVAPHQHSLDSIFSVIHDGIDAVGTNASHPLVPIPSDDDDRSHDRDLKEMMQAVSSFCGPLVPELGNGWDQKRNKSRLFAVTVITLPSQGVDHDNVKTYGQDYAVVHIAMSHAIGDGYTYYKLVDQLNQLMKEGYVTTPLRWNEPVIIQDNANNSAPLMGKLFFQIITLVFFASEAFRQVCSYLFRRNIHYSRFSIVNTELCNNLKLLMNKPWNSYLSTNDILVSTIATIVQSSFLIYRLNVRNRLEKITHDMAGEYSYPVMGDMTQDPINVRRYSTTMAGVNDLRSCSFSSAFTRNICYVSNWVSLSQFIDIPDKDFKLLCHIPLMQNFYRTYFVFKATTDHIALVGYNAPIIEGGKQDYTYNGLFY